MKEPGWGEAHIIECSRCGHDFDCKGSPKTECALCLKLGDRSLVWLLRAGPTPENIARFKAARGRSWMEDDVRRYLSRPRNKRPPMPSGLIQLAKERSQTR